MKKIKMISFIIIFIIIIIGGFSFYKIEKAKQLEIEKQEKIEFEKKEKEEQEKIIKEREDNNKKRKEDFLNTLSTSEMEIYKKNIFANYVIIFYKDNVPYKKVFTATYPKNPYTMEGDRCIEYSDITIKERNKEKEFCSKNNEYYEIESLDFNSL